MMEKITGSHCVHKVKRDAARTPADTLNTATSAELSRKKCLISEIDKVPAQKPGMP